MNDTERIAFAREIERRSRLRWRDRLALWLARPAVQRGFVLGPALVDRADQFFGHDDKQFSPEEYGNYIATSNGVYACATLRAELLSSLPIVPYRLRKNGADRLKITAGPLYELLQKVNQFWTANRLMTMTELSLCLWGEAYWFAERGDSRRLPPTELWWARPDRVRVVPDPVNYIKGFLYYPSTGAEPIPFAPEETIWLRFPNPMDEYSGLAPLAAARVAADYGTSAMRSNVKLFDQGLQIGGMIIPKAGAPPLTPEQSAELEMLLDRRFKGMDKAHRWGVLRFEAQFQAMGISPKDADFLGGLKWSLEDICRAMKVPLDLVGGQRTYENTDAAYRGVWTNCILPEARFIGTELTEQLLPMFVNQADLIDLDASEVAVLQAAESERWTIAKEQIVAGAKTINEWRESENQPKLDWGDVWWAPAGVSPIDASVLDGLLNPEPPPPPEMPPVPEPGAEGEAELPPAEGAAAAEKQASKAEGAPERGRRAVVFGSDEHTRLWRRFDRRAQGWEKRIGAECARLMERQRASVLARLRGRAHARGPADVADDPFDMAEWIKKFRSTFRPVLGSLVDDIGSAALDDIGVSISFNVLEPRVKRFIEQRAQRFAQRVNQTTWDDLRKSLSAGISAGEAVSDLAKRVDTVMGTRIRSSATTIARTEVIGASNGGTLLAWQQTDVVSGKEWLATADDKTRDTHAEAHGQRRGIDEDFEVGGGSGPAPGQIGEPEEDINCRCTMTAVLS